MALSQASFGVPSICRTDTCRVEKVGREKEDPFLQSLFSKRLGRMCMVLSNEAQIENG